MDMHKIIVIGSSAGGLKAPTAIAGQLPADLDAAIFIVQHISPDHESFLPQILSDTGELLAVHPVDGDEIVAGQIYVAPPDHHLLVNRDRVRIIHGPRENRHRPAIDALFRSAARAYGARVIGVVLSGLLDDGTVGAQAIKRRGGMMIVQSPADAEFPSMPASALRHARIDHQRPSADIPALLVELVKTPSGDEGEVLDALEIEAGIAEEGIEGISSAGMMARAEAIGKRTHYTCPSCNGSLWQIGDEAKDPLRDRCHVGHAFTASSLMVEQTMSVEGALWSAVRLMEEKTDFLRRMAERRQRAGLAQSALPLAEYSARLESEIAVLRRLIGEGVATRQIGKAAALIKPATTE